MTLPTKQPREQHGEKDVPANPYPIPYEKLEDRKGYPWGGWAWIKKDKTNVNSN